MPSSTTVLAIAATSYYVVSSVAIWLLTEQMARRPRLPPTVQVDAVTVNPTLEASDPAKATSSSPASSPPKFGHRLSFLARIKKSLHNPFFSPCWYATTSERVKLALLGPILAPPRLLCATACICTAGLISELATLGTPRTAYLNGSAEPLPLWRRSAIILVRGLARVYLFALGYHYIEEEGRPASRTDAPIVVSNHLGLLEPTFIVHRIGGMPVSRVENLAMPLFGAIGKIFQFLCVDRTDPESRKSVSNEILRRAKDDRWRQILLFPEGTTTAGNAVVTFKTGAFAPRLPVQPVAVEFPYTPGHFHPGWVSAGPSLGEICLRMTCQPYNRMRVIWLPPMAPQDDELAPAHPKLFAARVQRAIAAAINVPATEHSYEDVQLMTEAAKLSGDTKSILAANDSVVELGRLRRELGVDVKDAKTYLGRFRERDTRGTGRIDVGQFREIFGPNADRQVTERLFGILDEDGDGRLNFREYLVGSALFNAHDDAAVRQAFQLGFALFDRTDSGTLSLEEARPLLGAVDPITDADEAFRTIDGDVDGEISEAEFLRWVQDIGANYEAVRNRLFMAASEAPGDATDAPPKAEAVVGVADKEDAGMPGMVTAASGVTGLQDTPLEAAA